ncbi:MAG: Hsp20/alpha crystallin family protein [Thermoanaerobaculia bacterium]|nr:Spore protein SP21 [Thermoanaerobaculia bacterium]MCK6684496.1 Hsp20/alpha crystallin family protein [Thermoanaerobaculia bacterium]
MLVRWNDPFRELQGFQKEMNRLFSDALGGASRGDELQPGAWAPPVDIAETEDRLLFTVEVPGFKQEELSLNVEAGILTLRGERKFEKKTEGKNFHRIERSYGQFVRSFSLPSNVDPLRISADLESGVLTIELPKREETKPKSIPISIGKQITGHKAS